LYAKVELTILNECITKIFDLQNINICFTHCNNSEIDAIAALIDNSPFLHHLHLESYTLLEIDISKIIVLARIITLEYFGLVNISMSNKTDEVVAVLENNTKLTYNIKRIHIDI